MNDGAYDLVLIDADAASVLEYVEHGLRIARRGGLVLVARALWKGRVADPAQRDEHRSRTIRALLGTITESGAVQASLVTAGDGLLQTGEALRLGGVRDALTRAVQRRRAVPWPRRR